MSVVSSVASIFTGRQAAKAQTSATNAATAAEVEASNKAIEQQKAMFDQIQQYLAPYRAAGESAIKQQGDLLGINGNAAQQSAINNILNSAQFNTLSKQGENAILQNASATGGLRGGNTQNALANFRSQLGNQLINQQNTNLSGLTSLGQNAAANTGNVGMSSANNISNLLQSIGQSQANNYTNIGNIKTGQWNNLTNASSQVAGQLFGSGNLSGLSSIAMLAGGF